VDFFGSAGRDRVIALVRQIEDRTGGTPLGTATAKPGDAPRSYHAHPWVTRPRPGVDRMASAWLIRRFIDPDARFAFVADRNAVANVNVRSHTFKFISPAMSEPYGMPNPCTTCHKDESNEWASDALRSWPSVLSWRVAP
jgi:hypothetical protein